MADPSIPHRQGRRGRLARGARQRVSRQDACQSSRLRRAAPIATLAVLVLTLLGSQLACGAHGLLVFGAASLADALEAAGGAWNRDHPDDPVQFNFAGSNDLARQIAAGAPADLFVSADRAQLDAAERAVPGRVVPLLANRLVVIEPAGGDDAPARPVAGARDLLAFDRIALPDPQAVPAGVYARQWLEAEGVWQELAGRVVPALDVRANLEAVASGSLPVGVVYATDAAISDRVRVVYRVPPPPKGNGPDIVYWAAPIDGGDRAAAERFLAWLRSPAAGEIFRRSGFEPLGTASAEAEVSGAPVPRKERAAP